MHPDVEVRTVLVKSSRPEVVTWVAQPYDADRAQGYDIAQGATAEGKGFTVEQCASEVGARGIGPLQVRLAQIGVTKVVRCQVRERLHVVVRVAADQAYPPQ